MATMRAREWYAQPPLVPSVQRDWFVNLSIVGGPTYATVRIRSDHTAGIALLQWLEDELASGRLVPSTPFSAPMLRASGATLLPDGTSVSESRGRLDDHATNSLIHRGGAVIIGVQKRASPVLPALVAYAATQFQTASSELRAHDAALRNAFLHTTTDIAAELPGFEAALKAARKALTKLRRAVSDSERGNGRGAVKRIALEPVRARVDVDTADAAPDSTDEHRADPGPGSGSGSGSGLGSGSGAAPGGSRRGLRSRRSRRSLVSRRILR
jgi:hypothetical protein